MRPIDRHTFKDRAPLLAPWGKPQITDIKLTKGQVEGIVSAADPQDELRRVYRSAVAEPQKS